MTPMAHRQLRFLALAGVLVLTAYLVSYLVIRRVPSKPVQEGRRDLTPDIEVISKDLQYLHKEGDVTRLILRAERDTAFVDGRHTLEGVELQIFDAQGRFTGKLTAATCDYDPTARVSDFKGRVVIMTTDGLSIRTETLRYDREAETAATSDRVEFGRGRVDGEATGAHFDGKVGRLKLERAVRATVAPEKPDQPTTVITAGYGEYLVPEKRLVLGGRAQVTQRGDMLSAQTLTVQLDEAQRLRRVDAQTAAALQSSEKALLLTAQTLTFDFDPPGGLTRAVGIGQATLCHQTETERREVSGDRLEAEFTRGVGGSDITSAQVTGNARLFLVPSATSSASEQKRIMADTLRVAFAPGGRVLQTATADGRAVLSVTPLTPTPHGEQRTVRASRFEASFYPDGKIHACVATGGVELVGEPALPNGNRPPRKTTSDHAEVVFDAVHGELTHVIQTGNVTFEEGLRHARAERATFIKVREVIELRGTRQRPTIWDDVARMEAQELDIAVSGRRHVARGGIRTTYYDAHRTGTAGVFREPDAPVFITSNEAYAEPEQAVFIGDARCWQGDSFVRGDRLELFKADRRLTATGQVATAFYRPARPATGNPPRHDDPLFGKAETFTYSDVERRARYAEQVKLVQGDTVLTANMVEVELAARENRLERLTATGEVVIVQPGRRAVGDVARYTAADDRYLMAGRLARVEDVAQGTATAPEIAFSKSEGIVRASGGSTMQRVRTTYRLKP